MKRTSTYFAKPDEITERWRVMDAQGQTLGRLARNIAIALQGKDKTNFARHTLTGDFVVVTNAADMRVTGKKLDQKMYYRHSGYVGNLKTFRLRELMESKPDRVLELWWSAFEHQYKRGGYLNICLHPFVSGRALRIAMLDQLITRMKKLPGVWFPTSEALARHCLEEFPPRAEA